MDEELLVNQTGNITESFTSGDCVRPGCLGQLRGPIADWNDSTRNRRYYSRELWVKVFETDWVKEALHTHTLFGEADHPEERIEPLLTKAAVVLTDYEFLEDEKMIYGTFDILDTPSGRILRTLADYGCELGVSSRGRGNLINRNGRQEVDPDSYVFGGFDVVALPAVKKARQVFIKESDTRDFRIDIVDQIEMCESESDLRIIKNILDQANLSDIGKIDQLIESRISEFYPSDDDTIIAGLTRDLREACSQIESLKDKLDEVNSQKIIETVNDSELIDRLKLILRESGGTDTIDENQIVDEIAELIRTRDNEIAELNEGRSSKEMDKIIKSMSDELDSKEHEIENLTDVVNRLRESLEESKTLASESSDDLKEANEKVISLQTELDSILEEYNEVVTDYNSLLAKNNELVERHLNEQATRLNISRNDLHRLLPEGYDIDDIDDVVDSQMKIRRKLSKLPISNGVLPLSGMNESVSRIGRYNELPPQDSELESTEKLLMTMKKGKYNESAANS